MRSLQVSNLLSKQTSWCSSRGVIDTTNIVIITLFINTDILTSYCDSVFQHIDMLIQRCGSSNVICNLLPRRSFSSLIFHSVSMQTDEHHSKVATSHDHTPTKQSLHRDCYLQCSSRGTCTQSCWVRDHFILIIVTWLTHDYSHECHMAITWHNSHMQILCGHILHTTSKESVQEWSACITLPCFSYMQNTDEHS